MLLSFGAWTFSLSSDGSSEKKATDREKNWHYPKAIAHPVLLPSFALTSFHDGRPFYNTVDESQCGIIDKPDEFKFHADST